MGKPPRLAHNLERVCIPDFDRCERKIVNGDFKVKGNPALSSLSLPSLQSIEGNMEVMENSRSGSVDTRKVSPSRGGPYPPPGRRTSKEGLEGTSTLTVFED